MPTEDVGEFCIIVSHVGDGTTHCTAHLCNLCMYPFHVDFQMSLLVLGVKLWNSLSTSLTSVRSLYTFKRVYTNTLLSNYVENV